MDIKRLWEMYEESATKEFNLRKMEEPEKNYFTTIDLITQNGITSGILRCLEELERDKSKTLKKAFKIDGKIHGIDVDTGFGLWVPATEELPEKESFVLACFEDGFITGVEFGEDGEWELWQDSGDVIAWMPLPEPYKEERQ